MFSLSPFFLCVLLYHTSRFPAQPLKKALVAMLQFVQIISVCASFAVPYPPEFITFVKHHRFVEFIFGFAPRECVTGHGFMVRYLGELTWPLLLAVGFVSVFLLGRIPRALAEWSKRGVVQTPTALLPNHGRLRSLFDKFEQLTLSSSSRIPLSQRLTWYWPVHYVAVKNAALATQQGLLITLTRLSLGIFVVCRNPCGKETVVDFEDVQAYSPEWYQALPFACVALAVYCVGFLAVSIYAVMVAPHRVARDSNFAIGYDCLWSDFDAQAWWFGLVAML